ncbi:hypothetical protein Ancab_018491 [Ancistrocladus abbreviatus]
MADEPVDEFEPLFDYSRVQPNIVCLDDDDSDSSPANSPKRRKLSKLDGKKGEKKKEKVIDIIDCDKLDYEVDLFLPPPEELGNVQKGEEDSIIKELRLKKEELASLAQSVEDVLRSVEESAKRELGSFLQSSVEQVPDQPLDPPSDRTKIVVSVQDKEGQKQFRLFMDDKFERFFKMYADKLKLDTHSLVFCFDGEKISPSSTPTSLGMEDDDIIEVHVKSS